MSNSLLCSLESSSITPLYVQVFFNRFEFAPVSHIFTVPSAEADARSVFSVIDGGKSLKSHIASVCPIYVVMFKDESKISRVQRYDVSA